MTSKPGTFQKAPTISSAGLKIVSRTVVPAQPPVAKIPEDPAQNPGTKEQPPEGFKDPVTGAPTGEIPSQPTIESLTTRPGQSAVDSLGLIDQNARIQILLGTEGTAETPSEDIDTELTPKAGDKPGVDQGFESKPITIGENPLGSPMDGYKEDAIGGPLVAAAAGSGNGSPQGIAGLGIAAVSDGVTTGSGSSTNSDGEVQAGAGQADKAAEKLVEMGAANDKEHANQIVMTLLGIGMNRNGAEFLKGDVEIKTSSDKRNQVWIFEDGDKWVFVQQPWQEPGQYTPVGAISAGGRITVLPTPRPPKNSGGGVGRPDPDDTGSDINITTQSLLDQLNAARGGKPTSQGGGGDIMPTDGDDIGGGVRDGSITTNTASTNSRNLFGQPGGNAIGENVSGGLKGLDRFGNSNGPGAINPGPDGATPQGDSRFLEDPGKATGDGKPELSVGHHTNRRDQGAGNQAATATLSGDDGANTLRGSSAAEQLRGLGGNDRLFGMAGNDRIDGGLGRDLLEGGIGRDVLTGGGDADRFRYAVGRSFGRSLADRITDFRSQEGDRLEISRQAFGIASSAVATVVTARDESQLTGMLATGNLFVLDQRNGSLLFNQNGTATGAGSGGVFALLNGVTDLQASSLALVA